MVGWKHAAVHGQPDKRDAHHRIVRQGADADAATDDEYQDRRDGAQGDQAAVEVQMLALFALRALGVVDARARGLVVQTALPAPEQKN